LLEGETDECPRLIKIFQLMMVKII